MFRIGFIFWLHANACSAVFVPRRKLPVPKQLVDKVVAADPGKAGLKQSVNELERAQGKKAISKKVEEMLNILE